MKGKIKIKEVEIDMGKFNDYEYDCGDPKNSLNYLKSIIREECISKEELWEYEPVKIELHVTEKQLEALEDFLMIKMSEEEKEIAFKRCLSLLSNLVTAYENKSSRTI